MIHCLTGEVGKHTHILHEKACQGLSTKNDTQSRWLELCTVCRRRRGKCQSWKL